jgi:hypothetical protein
MVIEYMEKYGYDYALSKGYIQKNKKEKLHMKELFNMIAGTSTGGIVTAALSSPRRPDSDEPFYSDTLLDLYVNEGPEIYKKQSINKWIIALITILCTAVFGVLGYRIGVYTYANPKVENTMN